VKGDIVSKSYLDKGDRVVIVGNTNALGSSDLSEVQGIHGEVIYNNGWGLCQVKLDNGETVSAWNDADLKLE